MPTSHFYYVYILRDVATGKHHYTGVTHDLQERRPQLAHRDISEALANVEQLVEYIPDDALATLFQALYKEVSYNAAAQELNIVKYSA